MSNLKEIKGEEEVKLMVDSFYDKVNEDELLSPIFNDFAKVDWDKHLPIMYNFWGTVLFGKGTYSGSPFPKHLALPVEEKHFDRWVALFKQTIDENFTGEMAESVKLRAHSIAITFSSKIKMLKEQK